MDLTNSIGNLNSSVSMQRGLIKVKFDSGYRTAQLIDFTFLTDWGKVLFEVKGEMVNSWGVVVDNIVLQRLGMKLKEQSIKAYEESRKHPDDVYKKLLAKIREKRLSQTGAEELNEEDDEIEYDGITNYNTTKFAYKKRNEYGNWTNWSDWEKSDLTISMNLKDNVVKIFSPKVQTYKIINHNEFEIDESGIFKVPFKFVDNEGVHGTMRLQFRKNNNDIYYTQLYIDYEDIMWVYDLNDVNSRFFRNYE